MNGAQLVLIAFLSLSMHGGVHAQKRIRAHGTPIEENFNYFKANLIPLGGNGTLDSNTFSISGFSTLGTTSFGGAYDDPLLSGVAKSTGVTGVGLYGSGGFPLFQMSNTEFNPGDLVMRYVNVAGSSFSYFRLRFAFRYRNNTPRSNGVFVLWATSSTGSMPSQWQLIPASLTRTPVSANVPAVALLKNNIDVFIDMGVPVADQSFFFLKFRFSAYEGSGDHDEVGVDDIVLTTYESDPQLKCYDYPMHFGTMHDPAVPTQLSGEASDNNDCWTIEDQRIYAGRVMPGTNLCCRTRGLYSEPAGEPTCHFACGEEIAAFYYEPVSPGIRECYFNCVSVYDTTVPSA